MSTMLEQAIIDAAALKEAAVKNAESLIIEKYSTEIKETIDNLLEQDETDPLADLGDTGEEAAVSDAAKSVVDDLPSARQQKTHLPLFPLTFMNLRRSWKKVMSPALMK